MAAQGLRAQLQNGNLLTGQSLVVFDFFPHVSPEPMEYVAGMAVFPTMPESLDDILAKIDRAVTNLNGILVKLDSVPIEDIGNDLAQTMDSINAIPFDRISNDLVQTMDDINEIPIKQIGDNLATTTARLEALPLEKISVSRPF